MDVRLDFTHWPLLGIYVPATTTAEDLPALFATWERISIEQGTHVACLDLRDFNPVFASSPIRRVAAHEVRRGMEAYRASLAGVVRLVAHPLTRALLTAFDWMVPLPWPVLNTEHVHEAVPWLETHAMRAGLSLDGSLDLDRLRTRERHAIAKSA
jgi:hypothetical protein